MKRLSAAAVVMLLMLLAASARAESLSESVARLISELDLSQLDGAVGKSGLFEGGAAELLSRLASGRAVLTGEETLRWLLAQAAGIFKNSLWRITRIAAPALLASCAELIGGVRAYAAKAARYAGVLTVMFFLAADLREYVALCNSAVADMSSLMQGIFPMLTALLAAVGGTAGSVLYQPAVMAAAGSMTMLVSRVTMPVAVSVAMLTMVGSLSESLNVSKLCKLFRLVVEWTLGFGFTVFIGIMSVQGLSAAAVDGISIRTAKYAMDNFIPIVGGMFADTVDTLVGCSLLVKNALGSLGLILLMLKLLMPLMRTVAAMLLYRAAGALLQPMCNSPLCRAVGEYANVFTLLIIIQMSVGAMFMLLTAQLLTVGNLTVMLR